MSRLLFHIALALILLAHCKTEPQTKDIYGSYVIDDSVHVIFSKLNFYPENYYSFYANNCLSSNRDSGQFRLVNDTISFQSFNLPLVDTSEVKPLTGQKFVHKGTEILYLHKTIFPDKKVQIDTTCWTKKNARINLD